MIAEVNNLKRQKPLNKLVAAGLAGALLFGAGGTALVLQQPTPVTAHETPPVVDESELLKSASEVQQGEAEPATADGAANSAPANSGDANNHAANRGPANSGEVSGAGADGSTRANNATAEGSNQQPGLGSDPNEVVTTIVSAEQQLFDFVGVETRVVNAVKEYAAEHELDASAVEVVEHYQNAFTGFAIAAPRWAVPTIQEVGGVKTAFVEAQYQLPSPEQTQALQDGISEWVNGSALAMTGADKLGADGSGTLISIIDSGTAVTHEAFSGDLADDSLKLTAAKLEQLRGSLQSDPRYVSEKIPFSYDYADKDDNAVPEDSFSMEHGTHVASIAAANGGDKIRGTAPGAQLMVQKVFRNFDGGASDTAVLAALDDTARVLPDVVNLSLGSDSGFSVAREGLYTEIYQSLREKGVIVNVAAGNSTHAAIKNVDKSNLPHVTDPDYGIISTPASLQPNLAVASVDTAKVRPYLLSGDGTKIYYTPALTSEGASSLTFEPLSGATHKYAAAGYGTYDEFEAAKQAVTDAGGSPEETVFLVHRGGEEYGMALTFQNKVSNAGEVKAVLFIDGSDDLSPKSPVVDYTTVPSAMISKTLGEQLLTATNKTLTFDNSFVDAPDTRYAVSGFSSFGVTPELELKPDFAAPGGSVYAAVLDNQYESMSGTSMAAPQTAGLLAVIKKQLQTSGKYGNLSDQQAADLSKRLLMSTATPLTNQLTNTLYTPRQQGAGLVNGAAALQSAVDVRVVDAVDAARPSASLGDSKTGNYSFSFELTNLTGSEQRYTLRANALSDKIADGHFQTTQDDWTGRGITVSFSVEAVSGSASAQQVTVPATGSTTVKVEITAGDAFKAAVAEAVNGTYIDGFVRLESDSVPNLSIPFLGFYGDWGQAPIFDADLTSGQAHIYGSAFVNVNNGLPLGINPLDREAQDGVLINPAAHVKPERAVLSPTRYAVSPNQAQTVTGLLRNADTLSYQFVRDSDGEVVKEYNYQQVVKSSYVDVLDAVFYAEAKTRPVPTIGSHDEADNELEPGGYTLKQTAKTAGPGAKTSVRETKFRYDNTGPRVESAAVEGSAGDETLVVTVSDDTFVASIDLQETPGAGWYHREIVRDPNRSEDGRNHYQVSIPLSKIRESWASSEEKLGSARELPPTAVLYVWDYGLNIQKPLPVTLFKSPVTGVTIDQQELQLVPGQSQ